MLDDELPEPLPCPAAIDHVARVLIDWRRRANCARWTEQEVRPPDAWAGPSRVIRAAPTYEPDEPDHGSRHAPTWDDIRHHQERMAAA